MQLRRTRRLHARPAGARGAGAAARSTPLAPALLPALVVGLVGLVVSGCGGAGAPGTTAPTGIDGLVVPTPSPDPGDFVDGIDNAYLPLARGSTWTYAATGGAGRGTVSVRVTDETREVAGVMTTVVRSEVRGPDGGLVEESDEWFAQDRAGHVWYFGEATTTYDDGEPSNEASWEAGVDGARAGLVMPAEPRVGDGYRQEYLEGVAEDQREVLDIDGTVELPLEAYDDVLVIADTTSLDPELEEHAYYAPRIGLVAEETVTGGDERVVLTAYTPG